MRRVTLSTDRDLVVPSAVSGGWFCGSDSTTTTTATATTERLFEALRVYYSVILSKDRGLVVRRFCGGTEELSNKEGSPSQQRVFKKLRSFSSGEMRS